MLITEMKSQNSSTDKLRCYEALVTVAKPVTVTELQEANEDMANYSNQKLSALLRMLVNAGRIVKTIDKKKSYFSVNAD